MVRDKVTISLDRELLRQLRTHPVGKANLSAYVESLILQGLGQPALEPTPVSHPFTPSLKREGRIAF